MSSIRAIALIFGLLAAGSFTLLHTGPGPTVGKRLAGIRVFDGFGQPLGLGRSMLRVLAFLPSVGLAGLGLLWIVFYRERRGLHAVTVDALLDERGLDLGCPRDLPLLGEQGARLVDGQLPGKGNADLREPVEEDRALLVARLLQLEDDLRGRLDESAHRE
jgi:hypothetical protein